MNLKVNEIFYSIQGESTFAGLSCIFIRLTYCNLRCTWCDSEYTFYDGSEMTIDEIMNHIKKYNCKLLPITLKYRLLIIYNCINIEYMDTAREILCCEDDEILYVHFIKSIHFIKPIENPGFCLVFLYHFLPA